MCFVFVTKLNSQATVPQQQFSYIFDMLCVWQDVSNSQNFWCYKLTSLFLNYSAFFTIQIVDIMASTSSQDINLN